MPKNDPIQRADIAFGAQLLTFKQNIGQYSTLLGLNTGDLVLHGADTDYFNYVVQCQSATQNSAQQWTVWKSLVRGGGTPPATGMPLPPMLPTAVTAVAFGIEARFRALVKRIKAHANYNPAIGEALGIEGAELTAPDLSTVQPVFDLVISGGRVEARWSWQGNATFLTACELQVDRTSQGFNLLTVDTTPGYVDTQPFPATPTKWTYRAIYRVGDTQVGQWSNPVSIIVGG